MEKEDVDNAIPLFQGATDSGKIKKSSFKKWAVSQFAYFPCFLRLCLVTRKC